MKPFLPTLIFFFLIFFVTAQEKDKRGISPKEDSLQYLRDIVEYAPHPETHSASSLYSVAEICIGHRDYANTLKYINHALAKDSTAAAYWYVKAEALSGLKQYEAAIPHYQTAIRLRPGHEFSYTGLGKCYYQLKMNDLALQAFLAAARHCRPDCRDYEPYTMMAQIYTEQKKYELALNAWYKAVEYSAAGTAVHSDALYKIWQIETQIGNPAKADSALRKLIQLTLPDPDCPLADCYDYFACAQIVKIYTMQKEYDKAKPYMDQLGKRPGSAVE